MKALIIDGYNAIYKIPSLRRHLDVNLELARRELKKYAKEFMRKTGGIAELKIVFDGKAMYKQNNFASIKDEVYTTEKMGDTEIINQIRVLSPKYDILVVSDDNYVRNSSRSHNASVLSVKSFSQSIAKKDKATANKSNDSDKHLEEYDKKRINSELAKEWNVK